MSDAPHDPPHEHTAERPVGIGRPPSITRTPIGSPETAPPPISSGAVASSPRPRIAPAERRAALRLSIAEGSFASIHFALTGTQVGANVFTFDYARLLGAGNPAFGLLAAIPQIATVAQATSAYFAQRAPSRKAVCLLGANLSRWSVLLWPLLPLVCGSWALAAFLGFFAFSNIANAYGANAWMSWMADLVPRRVRGRYFSLRNNVTNVMALAVATAAGAALDRATRDAPAEPHGRALIAISAIFVAAVIAGAASTFLLKRQAEPVRPPRASSVPLREFLLAPLRDARFRPIVLFYTYFWAINGFGNPFWTPFIQEDLHQSNQFVTVLALVNGAASVLALPLWGRICDRFGAKPILVAVVCVTATHPLYYLAARPDFPVPIYFDAISSGTMWSGFNLAIFNLVLAAAPRGEGREMYYAAFNGAGGLSMAIVSTLSGSLLQFIPSVTILGLHLIPRQVVFFSVTWMRLLALVLLVRVKEPGRER